MSVLVIATHSFNTKQLSSQNLSLNSHSEKTKDNLNPPQNLWVDPLTSYTYWQPPVYSAFDSLQAYKVYLDGTYVTTTPDTLYQYQYLNYGTEFPPGQRFK